MPFPEGYVSVVGSADSLGWNFLSSCYSENLCYFFPFGEYFHVMWNSTAKLSLFFSTLEMPLCVLDSRCVGWRASYSYTYVSNSFSLVAYFLLFVFSFYLLTMVKLLREFSYTYAMWLTDGFFVLWVATISLEKI